MLRKILIRAGLTSVSVVLASTVVAARATTSTVTPAVVPAPVVKTPSEVYRAECGSCHLAYPPGLLPAASWQRTLGGLDDRHFGLARASSLPSQTMAGTVLGTPSYMSPEQAAGQPTDARSDVYSLGATLFHLLVGRPPFSGDVASVLAAHVTQPPPSPSSLAPGLPTEVDDLVLRMLAKEPEARFQSGGEVVDALDALDRSVPKATA